MFERIIKVTGSTYYASGQRVRGCKKTSDNACTHKRKGLAYGICPTLELKGVQLNRVSTYIRTFYDYI